MLQILIVEDDFEIGRLFARVLERNGYKTRVVCDGNAALDVFDTDYIDMVITDVMMPGMDGFSLVRTLRSSYPDLPVLMITARGDFSAKQEGFLSGADDYMVKPVDVNEMVLRVAALLRRSKSASEQRLQVGDVTLDYQSLEVSWPGGSLTLPQKEFLLLFKLLSSPGRIFTRQQIMDDVWGMESETDAHTVDVHINRLREHLRPVESFEILTVRGLGYKAVKK